MQPSVKALALSTLCLAVSACETTKRVVEHLPTPPERLVCERAGTRPTIPPEYQIDWLTVEQAPTVKLAVERAKAEVAKLIATVRTREGIVAGYVLKLEGVNFVCWNNAEWRRQYEAGIKP
jgi:hypothetical protein